MNLTQILTSVAPLVIALAVILFVRLDLRMAQGVFLLSGAGWIALNQSGETVAVMTLLAILLLGELVSLLLVGFLGTKLGPRSHGSFLIAIGLFPWYMGPGTSFTYGLLFLFFTALVALLQKLYANTKFNVHGRRHEVLSKVDYEEFRRLTAPLYPVSFALAAVCSVFLTKMG
jgi:hypothetical protein